MFQGISTALILLCEVLVRYECEYVGIITGMRIAQMYQQ